MQTFRLMISRHGRLLGHFESSMPWSAEAARQIAEQLGQADGFEVALLVADDERRIIESSSKGVRLLSRELSFSPVDMPESTA